VSATYSKTQKTRVQELRQLLLDRDIIIEVTDDTSLVTAANLAKYRAVVFLNTTGDYLTNAQQDAFEAYFAAGGGFLGIGSTIELEPGWQFLTDVLGSRAAAVTEANPTNPLASQTVTNKVADRVHDASKNLPEYWNLTDRYYNWTSNVRGLSHVLTTVSDAPFDKTGDGPTINALTGGTMGADHPVTWCKDYKGGRSYYTNHGATDAAWSNANLVKELVGAVAWGAGATDPVYSDCGATVLANYEQTKISGPPNLLEPIGFDQFPDGRIIQTARTGTVRLHNPTTGTTAVLANFGDASLPTTQRLYTNSEDGLYGPAVDNNFATNHWVYLYYSPQTVVDVKLSDGSVVTQTTPNTASPNTAPSKTAWDPWVGYFQLSRFKFVDDAPGVPAHLDLSSEQQIMKVSNNRQECCHVAGDIDFDKHNNLWLATGDDTPAGGVGGNGYGVYNDQLTDEAQTVRVTNATGGTFTLTFNGQTTGPLAFNSTAAQIDAALEALSNTGVNTFTVAGGPVNTANATVTFRRALGQSHQPQLTSDASGLTGATTPTVTHNTTVIGGWYQRPTGDDRRSTLNTNDRRGKLLRIKVKDADITAAEANKAALGGPGAYTIPAGNMFPLVGGAAQPKTDPAIHSMGFRNPFRLQVDENDVAYVSDYSPDANSPLRSRGPAGVGRFQIVREPENYGYPMCYSSKLGYYKWNYNEQVPLNDPPQPIDCGASTFINDSRWNLEGGPGNEIGLREIPPVADPIIWYSYNDNRAVNPLGTPCFGYYATTPGPIAPGSSTECPRLFPELYTGGVGAHGIAKYNYDPANPNPLKFPPYYDESVILGEFTQDTLREMKTDANNMPLKINSFLNCGQFGTRPPTSPFECDNPMDMQFGSDGAFYLLTYGDGFFAANPDAGMYKWQYVKGTRSPIAVLNTDRTDGPVPLTVNFSSAGSRDPDPGDSITYDWDFGDGTVHSVDPNPSHTYTTRGRYTAVLTVTDSSGKSTSVSTVITVGNTSPTVVVNTPVAGGTFAFGDNIPFSVTVTDPEDGPINCADVQVTFVLGHDTHGHAEASVTGCSGTLPTDEEDVAHGGNVFGVVSASYTDKGDSTGANTLTTTGQAQIRQKKQEAEVAISQSGTNVAATTDVGGGSHRGSLAPGDWIQLNGPFNLVNINSLTFRVADTAAGRTAGSPLAAVELRTGSATGPIVDTYNLVSTGGTAVWTSQTFPISLTGTNELFLVFRAVTGGQTGNNLFNLNWTEFGGAGIGVAP
jgi:PKD repeat protein/type 1 glutamine amidotransferase